MDYNGVLMSYLWINTNELIIMWLDSLELVGISLLVKQKQKGDERIFF